MRYAKWCAVLSLVTGAAGCTRESVRLAIAAQQRADDVQRAVFERQHDALCVLMYRDLVAQLTADNSPLTAAQHEALNAAWNDRDLLEFWTVQVERAQALRLAVVDARLHADQSIVDLLLKSLDAKAARAEQGLAAWAGEQTAESAARAAQMQPPNPTEVQP